jgi:hypothetical protein
MAAKSPDGYTRITNLASSASRAFTHGLTWLCVALAVIAIIAFVSQSWPLILFALGGYSAFTQLIRVFR